jgi:hypothetical protein
MSANKNTTQTATEEAPDVFEQLRDLQARITELRSLDLPFQARARLDEARESLRVAARLIITT